MQDSTSAGATSERTQSHNLRMGLTRTSVEAFSNDYVILGDDGADHRIRMRGTPPLPCHLEGAEQGTVTYVLGHRLAVTLTRSRRDLAGRAQDRLRVVTESFQLAPGDGLTEEHLNLLQVMQLVG